MKFSPIPHCIMAFAATAIFAVSGFVSAQAASPAYEFRISNHTVLVNPDFGYAQFHGDRFLAMDIEIRKPAGTLDVPFDSSFDLAMRFNEQAVSYETTIWREATSCVFGPGLDFAIFGDIKTQAKNGQVQSCLTASGNLAECLLLTDEWARLYTLVFRLNDSTINTGFQIITDNLRSGASAIGDRITTTPINGWPAIDNWVPPHDFASSLTLQTPSLDMPEPFLYEADLSPLNSWMQYGTVEWFSYLEQFGPSSFAAYSTPNLSLYADESDYWYIRINMDTGHRVIISSLPQVHPLLLDKSTYWNLLN